MQVIALDTHDGHKEGDVYDVPEHRARKLIQKGLVKIGPIPKNKMAPPTDNKANPTPAVGVAPIASSLPAAQASPLTIAKPSAPGDWKATIHATRNGQEVTPPTRRPRGRPPKARGA